jgi:hypothetical protein
VTSTGVAISPNHRLDRHAPEEFGNSAGNIDIPIIGDCKSVLQQLSEAIVPGPPELGDPSLAPGSRDRKLFSPKN